MSNRVSDSHKKVSKVSSDGTNLAKQLLPKEKMDEISIRYGETLTLPIDTGDPTDLSADIYVGKPGQAYIVTEHVSLVNGQGTFIFPTTDTQIPLDTYYYQINVTGAGGNVEKYPTPEQDCDDCEGDFPKFIVCEALDAIEVS